MCCMTFWGRKMKQILVFICVALACTNVSQGQGDPTQAPITLEELSRRTVVGKLGHPLGTAVEIEAELVAGHSLRMKAYDSLYLLNVTHVDGKELAAPQLMRFSVPGFISVKLANHTFALYELKHGKKAASLDSTQIAELEKGYVGQKVRLVVYEAGGFSGIPDTLPDDVPVWADSRFRFSTALTVLAERELGERSQ